MPDWVLHQGLPFLAAVAALFAGHFVRAIRWRVVLRHGRIGTGNLRPLAALTIGYIGNAILPFRIGELLRAATLSYLTKADFLYITATIVFERTLDLLVITGLLLIFFGLQEEHSLMILQQLAIAFALFAFPVAIYLLKPFRRVVWHGAAVFNSSIKGSILHFLWSLADIWTRSGIVLRMSFWGLTTLMWALYLLSIQAAAMAVGRGFNDVFSTVYVTPLDTSIASLINGGSWYSWMIAAYLFTPLVVMALYFTGSKLYWRSGLRQLVRSLTEPTRYVTPPIDNTIPRFNSFDQYGAFLDRKFRGENSLQQLFEDRAVGDVVVHRVFHGGSGAITSLVEQNAQLHVRKFAGGEHAGKLDVQHNWLVDHCDSLPLVSVLGARRFDGGALYDMEYVGGSRDLYEAVHTESLETSKAILSDVLQRVSSFHEAHAAVDASEPTVRAYVEAKVCANLKTIRDRLPEFFSEPVVHVNGVAIRPAMFDAFATPDWMIQRLRTRRQSIIHGDLTIENILVRNASSSRDAWYLIDPNPQNIFESPLIDMSKLVQSLHMGYESLNRDAKAILTGNQLAVNIHKSHQYNELHAFIVKELRKYVGDEALREVYIHEIVNYLRLIPYQFRKGQSRGAAFLGALCLILMDYDALYPGDLAC